jgi:formamidopyrimidine-DNA glycosylase
MPELPEIETVRLQLQKVLVGKKLIKIDILKSRTVKGDINKLLGQKLAGVERIGKVLLLDFGRGDKLGFHFKMTGQLIYIYKNKRIVGGHPTKDFIAKLPSPHTRVIFDFDGGTLYFNDQRLFGWIEINPKFVDKLGPEPFEIDEDRFLELFKSVKRPIKVALMDQEKMSGVGNIYANDACWEAGINPQLLSAQCSETQLRMLFVAINKVLREGIKYGGATAADAKYMNLHGLGGHYQDHFRVYDREGKKCLRNDGGVIKKLTLGGRGSYFCPVCQK